MKLCGYKNGGDRKSDSQNGNSKLTLDEIAKQLGTSKTKRRKRHEKICENDRRSY